MPDKPKRASAGGGGDWIDWVELGGEEAVVVVHLIRWDPSKDLGNGPVKPAICNVLIVDGTYEGTVKTDEEIIGKGMTIKLQEIEPGEDLVARVMTKNRGTTTYAIFQPPTDEEYDQAVAAMEALGDGDDGDAADEPEPDPEPEPPSTRKAPAKTAAKTPPAKGKVPAAAGRRPFG